MLVKKRRQRGKRGRRGFDLPRGDGLARSSSDAGRSSSGERRRGTRGIGSSRSIRAPGWRSICEADCPREADRATTWSSICSTRRVATACRPAASRESSETRTSPGVDVSVVLRHFGIPESFPDAVLEPSAGCRRTRCRPTSGPARPAAANPGDDRQRHGAGLRRRHLGRAARDGRLPTRRPHRRRLALRGGGSALDREAYRAGPASTSRSAPCRCCRRRCRTGSARFARGAPAHHVGASRDRCRGRGRAPLVRRSVIPQRPAHDLLGGAPTARGAAAGRRGGVRRGAADAAARRESARLLYERRIDGGSLDLDLPEVDLVLDDEGQVERSCPPSATSPIA